jgi:hypothetical protein
VSYSGLVVVMVAAVPLKQFFDDLVSQPYQHIPTAQSAAMFAVYKRRRWRALQIDEMPTPSDTPARLSLSPPPRRTARTGTTADAPVTVRPRD